MSRPGSLPATNSVSLTPLLEVSDLTIGFPIHHGYALAADRVEFRVAAGETLGIVGESGSGQECLPSGLTRCRARPWQGVGRDRDMEERGRSPGAPSA